MRYGLIGERLGHSYSQEIHESIAPYRYELCELAPNELDAFFAERTFAGINVTIPYKQTVIPYLDEISPTAARIGAVNTVVNSDGRLYGDNTDFVGMCELAKHAGVSMQGKKVLILGTGGTSKTACAVAERLGAREILRVSRRAGEDAVTYEEAAASHRDAQILIHTTPVGMFPNDSGCPLDLSAFPDLEGVLDAVYHPLRTNLVLEAQARGIPAEGGLYMLVAQAVYASARFRGIEPDPTGIESVFRRIDGEKKNLVFIGMPTCGKTTVGRLLAAQTGKAFVDTDDEIAAKIGEPVPDYIRRVGEPAFRATEHEVVADVAQRSGCVIATGGGAILDPDNVRALARNGVLIFLDRSPEKLLAAPDRPLSSDPAKLAALYEKRYPLYRKAADITVPSDTPPESVAQAVWKELTR